MKRFFNHEVTHGVSGISVGVGGVALAQHLSAWLQVAVLVLTVISISLTIASVLRKWGWWGNDK